MTFEEHKEAFDDYLDYCLNPDNAVSSWIRKLCQRHLDEMARVEEEDFPWFFDDEAVAHVLEVFSLLQLTEAQWFGKPFLLLRWQRMVIFMAYGWKWKETKQRRFFDIFIKVARKNGKTQFLAAIGIYGQSFDSYEDGCQVWWFATKKEQAKIGFGYQKKMAELLIAKSPAVAAEIKVMQFRIQDRTTTGYTGYLGKNSKGEDGFNPFYGISDEGHAQETDDMREVVTSGMVSRDSPMMWSISTEGFLEDSPFVRFQNRCKQALDGIIEMPETLPFIFDLDEGDDWEDEANWGKPNPSLGESLKIENLRRDYRNAKAKGLTAVRNFQTKNLNIRQKNAEVWIPPATWRENAGPRTRDELLGAMKRRICFGGLDLASVQDLCSYVLLFPPSHEAEKWVVLQWSWVPEQTVEQRVKVDAAPYLQFIERGELITNARRTTDYDMIKAKILWSAEEYILHSVGFDRYNAYQMIPQIEEYGIRMEGFNQSFPSMSAPTLTVETLATERMLEHGGDSLLAWAISNVVLEKKDDFVKPSKGLANEKIDPAVALIMATGQANEYMHEITAGADWSPMVVIGLK